MPATRRANPVAENNIKVILRGLHDEPSDGTEFSGCDPAAVLLEAVEDEAILPSQLDPARVQFLLTHSDEEIRETSKELLGGVKLARREEVIERYREVLDVQGDAAAGKQVFKAECSTCHLLEGVGYDLGLPLNATVRDARATSPASIRRRLPTPRVVTRDPDRSGCRVLACSTGDQSQS